jgi:hypothetical protein
MRAGMSGSFADPSPLEAQTREVMGGGGRISNRRRLTAFFRFSRAASPR